MLELPFGKGKPFASNGLAAKVFGNWQLNGLFSAFTGTPFTVTASRTSLNAPGNSQTADQVAPVAKLGGIGPGSPYCDPVSFAPITEARFGNTDYERDGRHRGRPTNASCGSDYIWRFKHRIRPEEDARR